MNTSSVTKIPLLNQTCEEHPRLFALDYSVLIVLLSVSMVIGIYYAWAGRDDDKEEYLLGGRKMKIIPVTMSLLASFMSPVTFVGLPVEVYQRGTSIWISILSFFVTNAVAAEIFIPIFYRLKITSVNTYIALRFESEILCTIASIMSCIAIIPWMGVVLYSPSLVLHAATGISENTAVIFTGILVTVYTSIGGLKAVVWTDVVQFTLMILGITVVLIKGIVDVGGLGEVWSRSKQGGRIEIINLDPNPYLPNNVWVITLGTIVNWGGSFSASQMLVQRACALPSLSKAKTVIYLALPGLQLLTLTLGFLGLVLFAFYHKCDPYTAGLISKRDAILPRFVIEAFGDNSYGVSGLFIACICSASLSTLSSGLNSMSTLIWEDWLGKYLPPMAPGFEVFCNKVLVAILGVVLIMMALLSSALGTIFQVSYALSGAPVGPLFGLFLVAMFCPMVDATGALSGFIAGEIACIFILIGQFSETYPDAVLETSTDECPLRCDGKNVTLFGLPFNELASHKLHTSQPTGLDHLFQITHFLIPFVGFIVTIIVSLTVNIIFPSKKRKEVDPLLLNDWAANWYLPHPVINAEGNGMQPKGLEMQQTTK